MSTTEFQSQVWEDYLKKQTAGALKFAFPRPTPGKIKAACQQVMETRFEKRDERMLRDYFMPSEYQNLEVAIRRFDRDRFRPLNSYLQDPSIKTNFDHIQLLAWLIDYPNRPYQSSYSILSSAPGNFTEAKGTRQPIEKPKDDLIQNDPEDSKTNDSVPKDEPKKDSPDIESEPEKLEQAIDSYNDAEQKKTSLMKTAMFVVSVVGLLAVGYVIWLPTTVKRRLNDKIAIPIIGQQGCVIWDNDHYESIPCKQQVAGIAKFGVDVHTVSKLRRVTLLDTVTPNSIKNLWYAKIDGRLELFTCGGFHPVRTNLRLLPLTLYMYNKYLFHYKNKVTYN